MLNQANKYLVSIDSGTTSCRAIVFDAKLQEVVSFQRSFTQIFPQTGWVEHDPSEIWKVQQDVLNQAIRFVGASHVEAIGIANQRETAVAWSRSSSEPLTNAIVWQCKRTVAQCSLLMAGGQLETVRWKTGLLLDPYFSATKWKWMLENVPSVQDAAKSGDLAFGTVDSWLIWNMTQGASHATDPSNASRTLIYNIHDQQWDSDLSAIFGVPIETLPQILDSDSDFGTYKIDGVDVKIRAVLGDQQAALFGQGCYEPGMLKCTLGTGSFLLVNAGNTVPKPPPGILATVAWKSSGSITYALEGSVFVAGAAVQWLRDGLEVIPSAAAIEELAATVPDTAGVIFVPALSGLGAPYWNPNVRGVMIGITRSTTKAHIARATLEAIAMQNADLVDALRAALPCEVTELRLDGGAAINDCLVQLHADYINCTALRPACLETTAMGVAALAGIASQMFEDTHSVSTLLDNDAKRFFPVPTSATFALRKRWTALVLALDALEKNGVFN